METTLEAEIDSFVAYVKQQVQAETLPKSFLKIYYALTYHPYVSLSDAIYWLKTRKDAAKRAVLRNYGPEYLIEITEEEDRELRYFEKKSPNTAQNGAKFYKIRVDVFKKLCMSSHSKIGLVCQEYFLYLEEIVKRFHKTEMARLREENETLRRNQAPSIIPTSGGVYVWKEPATDRFRMGSSEKLKQRMSHHSSHSDNLEIIAHVLTNCEREVENVARTFLKEFAYRKNREFLVSTTPLQDIKTALRIAKRDCESLISPCAVGVKASTRTVKRNKKDNK